MNWIDAKVNEYVVEQTIPLRIDRQSLTGRDGGGVEHATRPISTHPQLLQSRQHQPCNGL